MKLYLKYIASALVLISSYSCNNHYYDNPEHLSDMSIQISSRIYSANTRVAGNSFEQHDEIGFYVVPYSEGNTLPGDIDVSGYAPNVPYRLMNGQWLPVSGNEILWPGIQTVDVYGYYPYDASLTTPNAYRFQVKTNQQTHADYSLSDFLWAKRTSLSPVRQVELVFSHLLSKINVNIRSGHEELVLDTSRLTVTVTDVQTAGMINLGSGQVATDENQLSTDVIFRKQHVVNEGYDASFTGIVIPQVVPGKQRLLLIEHDGMSYAYTPSDAISFAQGTTQTFNIVVNEWGISVTVNAINDWDDGGELNGNVNEPAPRVLSLSAIDWAASSVHHIYDGRVLIGQVCKEYVYRSGTVDVPAIVVYPMDADGNVDLTKGFVAQVFNRSMNASYQYEVNSGNVHGGAVSFDKTKNVLSSFQVGVSPLTDKVEMASADDISAAADYAIPVLTTAPYTLTDIDGNVYPIVKVATQYWISENLRTEHYLDGSSVPVFYYSNNRESFRSIFGGLYSWITLADERGIAPEGWTVPTEDDWYSLRDYLYPYPGTKLKKPGIWSANGYADNVTGFAAQPGGYKTNLNTFGEIYNYGQWWSSTSKTTADAWRVYFGTAATIASSNLSKAYSQSIRLMRTY